MNLKKTLKEGPEIGDTERNSSTTETRLEKYWSSSFAINVGPMRSNSASTQRGTCALPIYRLITATRRWYARELRWVSYQRGFGTIAASRAAWSRPRLAAEVL